MEGKPRKPFPWGRATLVVVVVLSLGIAGCVSTLLPAVDMSYRGPPPRPEILGAFGDDPPVASAKDWAERRAPLLRDAFQKTIYGRMPAPVTPQIVERHEVKTKAIGPDATAEQWTVQLGDKGHFHMVVVAPKAPGPHPVIIMENFCGNPVAFSDDPKGVDWPITPVMSLCHNKMAQAPVTLVFGRNINGPPFREVISRGYAVALFYAGDVVADEPGDPKPGLVLFAKEAPPGEAPGALAIWGWLYSRALDALATDKRFDATHVAIWGHSRNGKAALVAAALDPRIAAVIAHQSGKGGATLTRSYAGESVAQITRSYPHWFNPAYATYAGKEESIPVDQHQLIALIAPRPVFIGAARRDKWSDPEGAFRALQGADTVYKLYGSKGLDQPDMKTRNLKADLSFVLRDGTHGVTSADWRNFLAFLDAHGFTSGPAKTWSADGESAAPPAGTQSAN